MMHLERVDNKNLTSIDVVRYEFAGSYVKGKNVLDIACGNGYGTIMLLKSGASEVYGVDLEKNIIAALREKYSSIKNLFFNEGSAYEIPFPNDFFDTVVSIETLEHLQNPKIFLKEVNRVLKPNGLVILSTPLNESETRFSPSNPFHVREYNLAEFKDLLKFYFIEIDLFFQRSVLKPNWLTGLINRLEDRGVEIRKLKRIISTNLILRIRKMLHADKNKVLVSEIIKNHHSSDVVIAVAKKSA